MARSDGLIPVSGFTKERRLARRESPTWGFIWEDAFGRRINLTGATLTFMMKDNINDEDADAILTKSMVILGNPEDGVATLNFTKEETNRLGAYWAEVEAYYAGTDDNVKLSRFILHIDPSVKTA